jgi:hypothetical protein
VFILQTPKKQAVHEFQGVIARIHPLSWYARKLRHKAGSISKLLNMKVAGNQID